MDKGGDHPPTDMSEIEMSHRDNATAEEDTGKVEKQIDEIEIKEKESKDMANVKLGKDDEPQEHVIENKVEAMKAQPQGETSAVIEKEAPVVNENEPEE